MRASLIGLGWTLGLAAPALGTPLDDAVSAYKSKHYSEAESKLEVLAAADPSNPWVCYLLGMSILKTNRPSPLDEAEPWLEKASRLEPSNARYLSDFAGTCLQLADLHNSFSYASEGRDLMEKALVLDPTDLAGRDGLMQFYAKAPWPLGDLAKARSQAQEIARQNPKRGAGAYAKLGAILAKKSDLAEARQAFQDCLQIDPHNQEASVGLSKLPNKT